MTWTDAALWSAFLIGVAAAGFIVARRPAFWVELGLYMAKKLWPLILGYVLKRNDAETEERMRQCTRSGGKWNNFKKRCE
jgi:hypothetical protein